MSAASARTLERREAREKEGEEDAGEEEVLVGVGAGAEVEGVGLVREVKRHGLTSRIEIIAALMRTSFGAFRPVCVRKQIDSARQRLSAQLEAAMRPAAGPGGGA